MIEQEKKVICYLRLHKRLDEALDVFAVHTGMRRATACAWILSRFVHQLMERLEEHGVTLADVRYEDLEFTDLEELYFFSIGRTSQGSVLGRGTRVTLTASDSRAYSMISALTGIREQNLRCGVLAQYFRLNGML